MSNLLLFAVKKAVAAPLACGAKSKQVKVRVRPSVSLFDANMILFQEQHDEAVKQIASFFIPRLPELLSVFQIDAMKVYPLVQLPPLIALDQYSVLRQKKVLPFCSRGGDALA